MASAHPQGGNRMGEDKSASVVNSNCQSHEIKNLFICDASVFPTAVEVNKNGDMAIVYSRTGTTIYPTVVKYHILELVLYKYFLASNIYNFFSFSVG